MRPWCIFVLTADVKIDIAGRTKANNVCSIALALISLFFELKFCSTNCGYFIGFVFVDCRKVFPTDNNYSLKLDFKFHITITWYSVYRFCKTGIVLSTLWFRPMQIPVKLQRRLPRSLRQISSRAILSRCIGNAKIFDRCY